MISFDQMKFSRLLFHSCQGSTLAKIVPALLQLDLLLIKQSIQVKDVLQSIQKLAIKSSA